MRDLIIKTNLKSTFKNFVVVDYFNVHTNNYDQKLYAQLLILGLQTTNLVVTQ